MRPDQRLIDVLVPTWTRHILHSSMRAPDGWEKGHGTTCRCGFCRQGPSLGLVVDIVHPHPARWLAEIEELRGIAALGHVELWMEHIPTVRETEELRAVLEGTRVTVHAPFVDMSLVTRWPDYARASMQRLRAAIHASQALDAEVFTIHAGKFPAFESQDEALKRFVDRYETLRNRSAELEIAVENLKSKSSGVSREAVASRADIRFLRDQHRTIKFTPDVGHALQNGEDPIALLEECGADVACVHVHDASRGGRSHRRLGEGELRLSELASYLLRVEARFVTLELLTLADGEASLQSLSRYLTAASTPQAQAA